MTKAFAGLLIMITLLGGLVPVLALAQEPPPETGLVPDCPDDKCGFIDFLKLVDNVFQAMVWLAVPLASVVIAYAGIILVTAQGDTGKRNQAKELLWTAVFGLVIVLAAWLIINTVLDVLAKPNFQL